MFRQLRVLTIAMGWVLCLNVMVENAEVFARDLDCLIEPFVVVTVSSPEVGLLEEVSVDRGDVVEKDQVVAVLDSSVESATGSVNHARARLTNDRLADMELRKSTAEIARRTIRSPIPGVVMERSLSTGEFAKQDPILKIAQLDPLRVEAFAPVAMLGKIVVGAEAQVLPQAPVNGTYQATVTVVDRVIDAASGTFGVRLELPNPNFLLSAGLKCKLRFAKE
jgi:multidrug efflux pump subunit AcrA (membrane-fusion protein)